MLVRQALKIVGEDILSAVPRRWKHSDVVEQEHYTLYLALLIWMVITQLD